MPTARGTLIGFIELGNSSRSCPAPPEGDSTVWETLMRLGSRQTSWDDWDTPPSKHSGNLALDSPRIRAAYTRLEPSHESIDFPKPPGAVLTEDLEVDLGQLLTDLELATQNLQTRIAFERRGQAE